MSDPTTSEILSNVSMAVTILAAVLGLPPLVYQTLRMIKKSHNAEEMRLLRDVATVAVTAVEKTMKTEDGQTKLREATKLASKQLAAYGVKVEPDQLRAAIESAVLLSKAALQLPPAPTGEVTDPALIPQP